MLWVRFPAALFCFCFADVLGIVRLVKGCFSNAKSCGSLVGYTSSTTHLLYATPDTMVVLLWHMMCTSCSPFSAQQHRSKAWALPQGCVWFTTGSIWLFLCCVTYAQYNEGPCSGHFDAALAACLVACSMAQPCIRHSSNTHTLLYIHFAW
jgi:hypothetical protein